MAERGAHESIKERTKERSKRFGSRLPADQQRSEARDATASDSREGGE